MDKPSWKTRAKSFFTECRRVWQVTRKPTKDELKVTLKVTGIGILIIGFVGFLITLLWQLLIK